MKFSIFTAEKKSPYVALESFRYASHNCNFLKIAETASHLKIDFLSHCMYRFKEGLIGKNNSTI